MSLQLWLVSPVRQGHTQPVGGKRRCLPSLTVRATMPQINSTITHVNSVGQHLSYVVHQRNHSVIIFFSVWFYWEDMWNRQGAATALLHVLSKGVFQLQTKRRNEKRNRSAALVSPANQVIESWSWNPENQVLFWQNQWVFFANIEFTICCLGSLTKQTKPAKVFSSSALQFILYDIPWVLCWKHFEEFCLYPSIFHFRYKQIFHTFNKLHRHLFGIQKGAHKRRNSDKISRRRLSIQRHGQW